MTEVPPLPLHLVHGIQTPDSKQQNNAVQRLRRAYNILRVTATPRDHETSTPTSATHDGDWDSHRSENIGANNNLQPVDLPSESERESLLSQRSAYNEALQNVKNDLSSLTLDTQNQNSPKDNDDEMSMEEKLLVCVELGQGLLEKLNETNEILEQERREKNRLSTSLRKITAERQTLAAQVEYFQPFEQKFNSLEAEKQKATSQHEQNLTLQWYQQEESFTELLKAKNEEVELLSAKITERGYWWRPKPLCTVCFTCESKLEVGSSGKPSYDHCWVCGECICKRCPMYSVPPFGPYLDIKQEVYACSNCQEEINPSLKPISRRGTKNTIPVGVIVSLIMAAGVSFLLSRKRRY